MKQSNKFGHGDMYTENDLEGTTYITCAACMSIYAEAESWANANKNKMSSPQQANNIVVLSCQVTDLAILNDISTMNKLKKLFPGRRYFIGGCLAKRFDVNLPKDIKRIDSLKVDYQKINEKYVEYVKPFWVKDFNENDDEFSDGHIFRNMYPMRIGVGCHGKCEYCTIVHTRGEAYQLDIDMLEDEFLSNDNVLAIADSIYPSQIKKLSNMAIKNNKQISFRNVEPQNVIKSLFDLIKLAEKGLLKIIHTPIQSTNVETLIKMNRKFVDVIDVLEVVKYLKSKGVFTATNIIIDFDNKKNNIEMLKECFDYISWNPYWNGVFNYSIALKRWQKYLS